MTHTRSTTAGLILLGLLSLTDVLAWRGARMALGWLVGLRVLSAVSAVPAFVVPDVPSWAQLFAAAFIVLTVLGCALALLGRPGKVAVPA